MERTIEQLDALRRLERILELQEIRDYNHIKLLFLTFTVPTLIHLKILENNPEMSESEYIAALERESIS